MLQRENTINSVIENNQFSFDSNDAYNNFSNDSSRLLRVATLYRVSSKKQVGTVMQYGKSVDDIPLQRKAAREFCQNQGWVIVAEFEEKGVSGYKVSANKRDAIQDLKDSALRKEFDILLVFLFDRLGRIESETPFVVQWFIQHGIQVWSVNEGQQKIETHTDKLMNYIRFWQAEGESEKTSIRIKTRLKQMTLDGIYTGGHVPFGYKLIGTGEINRKGREIKFLQIEPAEAEIVRHVFYKARCEGYGSHRLAAMLNDMGIKTHSGAKFQCNTILRILRNKLYCGYFVSGGVESPFIPELAIIEVEEFEAVAYLLDQRGILDAEKREIALSTKGKALLSGIAYCAHCGGRLNTIHYKNTRYRRDGSSYVDEKLKYSCYHKSRKLCECDGQNTYYAERVDEIVVELVKKLFLNMKEAPEEEYIQQLFKKHIAGNKTNQKRLEIDIKKSREQLESLQLEIGKTITGDSPFSVEDLSAAIKNLKEHIDESQNKLILYLEEEKQGKEAIENIRPAYMQFKSWSEEFENATLEQKKVIIGHLFQRVEVGKDYNVNVVLDMTYQQFCEEWKEFSDLIAG